MKLFALLVLVAWTLCAQPKEVSKAEQEGLQSAIQEAGNSPIEFIRALEKHLAKFPDSPKRPEIERALVKSAIEAKDQKRTALYGERVLARDRDDLQVLERTTHALLETGGKEEAAKAAAHARHMVELTDALRKEKPDNARDAAHRMDELDRALARALVLEARAEGKLGAPEKGAALARRSFEIYPSAEAAREAAAWLAKSGKPEEALDYYANAFTIAGSQDPERVKDRVHLGEIYRQRKGSEAGLGDLVLKAYDRTSALLAKRREQQREIDPNSQLTDPMRFTLSGLKGEKLALSSLLGKVVVMDFWATWCGPCRAQHPLYEEVKKRFKDRDDVVFLAISSDEERELVGPFVESQHWNKSVWFEDGLAHLLNVSSIPTTVIFNKKGEVVSRMIGFVPERFVAMLSERIQDALKSQGEKVAAR